MKLRYSNICAVVLVTLLFSSCDSWLDVRPKSEVKADNLYSTEAGFRQALFGIYGSMSNPSVYGGNLTMGFLDVLAQNYAIIHGENHNMYYASIYDYTEQDTEKRIGTIWSSLYNRIANCNYLLENLEGSEHLFQNDNYVFFKAEVLALRAYLHFDLLRLYAPSVAAGGLGEPAIPFVDKVQTESFKQSTGQEILNRVITELVEAKDLLRDIDPIGPAFEDYKESNSYGMNDYLLDDGFLLYRKSRMNYYAINGLLARVYLYAGEKDLAKQAAIEVINSGKFTLVEEEQVNTDVPDRIFFDEVVFALYNDNLKAKSNVYFKDGDASKDEYPLLIPATRRKLYFPSGEGAYYDFRLKYQFGRVGDSTEEYIIKYNHASPHTVGNSSTCYIPMIRMSEMYYIAAECETDPAQAIAYINSVRQHRGYDDLLNEGIDFESELMKEYRKEFLAEGQMFYYLKRKNIETIPYSSLPGDNAVYVLPIPDVEIEYGNIN